MSYLEKLFTVYCTMNATYLLFAIMRDIKTIRIDTIIKAHVNERKTLIENVEVERSKNDRLKLELKQLFDTLLKERSENNKKENKP